MQNNTVALHFVFLDFLVVPLIPGDWETLAVNTVPDKMPDMS